MSDRQKSSNRAFPSSDPHLESFEVFCLAAASGLLRAGTRLPRNPVTQQPPPVIRYDTLRQGAAELPMQRHEARLISIRNSDRKYVAFCLVSGRLIAGGCGVEIPVPPASIRGRGSRCDGESGRSAR